jgi:hypothetical protein
MTGTPSDPPDKLQREIEELLDRLDNFVPEERFTAKMRNRRRQPTSRPQPPGWLDRVQKRLERITLGQVLIAGLIILAVSFLFDGPLGGAARWLTILGLVMTVGAFVLSVIRGGSNQAAVQGRVQRRWRGQIIEYGEPSRIDRVRGWFRRRGRR